MRHALMELLACPHDQTIPLNLDVEQTGHGEILQGRIVCPSCLVQFHIVHGIPIFLQVGDDEVAKIQLDEIAARDRGYSGHTVSDRLDEVERYPELDALRQAIGDCHGLTALDAGCGVGKMTQLLRPAARVVGVDFSMEGLLKFDRRHFQSIDLMRGDVCRLPFRREIFDLAITSQVLEHIPTQQMRAEFVRQVANSLKPGGKLVLTVYNWDRNRSEKNVPKEGFHPKKIFYHCYTPNELRSEMEKQFHVEAIWGVQVLFPKTYRFVQAMGSYYQYWDRLWRKRPIATQYSNLLLVICRRLGLTDAHPSVSL